MDEALAVGDAMFQLKCYRKFNEFREQGKTILFVTHSMDTLIRYCTSAIVLNEGVKIEEGSPKEMVDLYKRITVNLFEGIDEKSRNEISKPKNSLMEDDEAWKELYENNPQTLDYGTKEAEIFDYGIFDSADRQVTDICNYEYVSFKMKVRFHKDITDPIFALTIKDMKGYEITGTNTMIEKVETGTFYKGDEVTISFNQILRLNAGTYTLSLGCTGFSLEEFIVYYRLYDVILFQVSTLKNTVGIFDMDSTVEVNRTKQVNLS
ncbi:Wzt carbohydrate-binding domain-containing protein [Aneurinibacillus thermoaerophilus]|uniref:Wzt carbohydrate-binding domain-containing protein n=1 Tax=Aneurinibacillus thermoaerophilus TaxID=143495 RepID=UPI002E229008|nr:Wzt carbohydrate-binding domain-containing protein [Aneurinibacillus thermoaerophilus]MED0763920.1 Wzt carbohydrate-binding domain-containing protein [Aneurinibacillus thermoaerophilus]